VLDSSRDTVLKEIREDALILEVDWEGVKYFVPVCKEGDFFLDLTGKDGQRAITRSQAALHMWEAEGKEWRKRVRMKKDARLKARAHEHLQDAATRERDLPWAFSPPDLEALANLHAHKMHGDMWIKEAPPA
jgi:hypothetical protein